MEQQVPFDGEDAIAEAEDEKDEEDGEPGCGTEPEFEDGVGDADDSEVAAAFAAAWLDGRRNGQKKLKEGNTFIILPCHTSLLMPLFSCNICNVREAE